MLNGLTGVVYITLFGASKCKKISSRRTPYCLIEGINLQIGKRRKWWVFYNKPNSYLFNEFPFNIGPFLVGSMWILKWTYGNLKKFIFLNVIVDGAFAYIMAPLLKR